MTTLCVSFFHHLALLSNKRCRVKSTKIYNERIIKRGSEKKKRFHLVSKKDIIFEIRNLISQNVVYFENKSAIIK